MNSLQLLPKLIVEIDGSPLCLTDTYSLSSVRVQQRLSLPTLCELTFFDPQSLLSADAGLATGVALQVRIQGYAEPLFVGQVTALEYIYPPHQGQEVRVRGYDLLHRLRKRYPVRAHVQVTTADLAREMLSDWGVAVTADQPGPLWPRIIQDRQSDLDLLAEVAERSGLYFVLRPDGLHLLSLAGQGMGEEGALPLVWGESLLEARIEVNDHADVASVATAGWDPLRLELHQGKATKMGQEAEVSPPPWGEGERILVNQAMQNDAQAEAIAQAELDRLQAQAITFWGVAEGNPDLQPGRSIQVRGLVSPADRYRLTSVNHLIHHRQGFISEISTVPPPRRRPPVDMTTFGTVTQINDPEGLGRIQVALPTYSNVETSWMAVLTPGAGVNKGLVSLPDVGDRVLVLFTQGDPAQGVILGGLYGVQDPPDWGIEAGRVKRHTWLTPGGQQVQLDDTRGWIRLNNRDGSYIELSPEQVLIHAATDLTLEAPGRTVSIRGQLIEFERS